MKIRIRKDIKGGKREKEENDEIGQENKNKKESKKKEQKDVKRKRREMSHDISAELWSERGSCVKMNHSHSCYRNYYTQHGFLYLACIQTRYIVSSFPRFTCRRRSTRFCTSSKPASSNRLFTSA